MPTFDMPVRFVAGRLVTCEPGSPEYVQAQVVTTLRCTPGDRMASPAFGVVTPEFEASTVDPVEVVVAQVQRWVPDVDTADVLAVTERVGG